jgi:hypothetical protein
MSFGEQTATSAAKLSCCGGEASIKKKPALPHSPFPKVNVPKENPKRAQRKILVAMNAIGNTQSNP